MLLPLLFAILLSRQALALHCLQPYVPENGHVIFNEPGPYAPKTVAKYSCALGFERIGREERICMPNGLWSGKAPVCAIDVAAGKPTQQSSGDPLSVKGICATTLNENKSWWEVELLGAYDVHSLLLRPGPHSSQIIGVELITDTGDIHICDVGGLSSNASQSLTCGHSRVSRVRVTSASRLQLCAAHVFATNAVSGWQCAQGSMDVLTVVDGQCISASREEHSDWPSAQRKCLDRGGSLPLRMSNATRKGIQAALDHSDHRKDFFWIGVSSSASEWRWADGEAVVEPDWPLEQEPPPGRTEAVLLAKALDWRWLPASQAAWNAFLCQSKPKFCTSPGVGEAAKVQFSSHSYAIGTHCFYTCDDGYELEGGAERECLESGRWSGKIPDCKRLDCGELPDFPEGIITLLNSSSLYMAEAEYSCSIGYEIEGERRRQCGVDGLWDGEEPTCKIVECGRPPTVANGQADTISQVFNSAANYSCQEGYRLLGPETIFCGERGNWEPSAPVCYDEASLHQIKKQSDAEGSIVLAVLAIILVAVLVLAVFRVSWSSSSSALSDKSPVIYATPSVPMPGDSVVYYASCAAVTQVEVPPHMLSLQHLPNGNIHVTLPAVTGRPITRPPLPSFRASPTPSQILYSFDHEPIYDTPPDLTLRRNREENIYERMADLRPPPPPPPLPKASHRREAN